MKSFATVSRRHLAFLVLLLMALPLLAHAQASSVQNLGGSISDRAYAITVDGAGNYYVTGYYASANADFDGDNTGDVTNAGDDDIFVAKYAANGTLAWVRGVGGSGEERGLGIAVDAAGNVFITGYYASTNADFDGDNVADLPAAGGSGTTDIFVAKFDGTGTFQWARAAGGTGTSTGQDVAVDAAGNVYATGYFNTSADFDGDSMADITGTGAEVFVAKYDAMGTLTWVRGAGGAGTDEGDGIAVDASGNSYVTGTFNASADFNGDSVADVMGTGDQVFLAKYDVMGTLTWVRQAGGSANFEKGFDAAVDGAGNVYVTGYFASSNADFDGDNNGDLASKGSSDIFLAKYDAMGTLLWVRGAGGSGADNPYGVAVDGLGNVYIAGRFASAGIDFDGDSTNDITNVGSADVFVAKYDAAGVFLEADAAGGTNFDSGQGVAVDGSGNIYVTGFFLSSTADFNEDGANEVTSAGGYDAFVAKYAPAALPVELTTFEARRDREAVALSWQTVGETNNAGFFIERRVPTRRDKRQSGEREDETWQQLGFVEGRGTTTVPQAYRFEDTALPFEATTLLYRLRQIDFDGAFEYSPEVEVLLEAPKAFALEAAYPNPFNPTTTIRYALPAESEVRLAVYDVLGREVAVLLDGRQAAGRHAVVWEAGGLSSGVYFYRIVAGQFSQARRVTLLK